MILIFEFVKSWNDDNDLRDHMHGIFRVFPFSVDHMILMLFTFMYSV